MTKQLTPKPVTLPRGALTSTDSSQLAGHTAGTRFWVLRSVYDFDDTTIARAIEGALGLPRVQVEDSERVKLALAAVADRIDIADALHLASTPGDARAFATFDRDLARRGNGRLSPIEVL